MEPRKPTSNLKKAVIFPPDLLKMLSQEFRNQHEAFLSDKEIIVEGLIFQEEICLSIGFKEPNSLRQTNFQASVDYKPEGLAATEESNETTETIHFCADAIDNMMKEYIAAEGDISMPHDWKLFTFNGKNIFLRQDNENTEIEKLTREFLEKFPEDPGFNPESPIH